MEQELVQLSTEVIGESLIYMKVNDYQILNMNFVLECPNNMRFFLQEQKEPGDTYHCWLKESYPYDFNRTE